LLISVCPARTVFAQNENETVGFQSQHMFEAGYFGENVDILNGGVNVTTPIGSKYQLNQNLGYQVQVAYGSKIWDKGEWTQQAYLYRRGALGLGSLLHFGRIYRDVAYTTYQYFDATAQQVKTDYTYQCTWYYVTPDGNEHVIPGNYRPDQNALTCDDAPPGGYTIDNTFYSFFVGSGALVGWNGSGAAPTLVIVTPDRIKYTFGHFVAVPGFESAVPGGSQDPELRNYNRDFGGWYVTRIEDTRTPGNVWVNIEYDTRAGFDHLISRITDSDTREILVTNECEPDTTTSGCKEGSYGGNAANRPATRVKSILLPAFKGSPAVDNTRRAQYDFAYEWRPIYNLFYPNDASHAQSQNILRSVSYPSITKRSGPAERYQLLFDYDTFGELNSRTLPTGTPPSGSYLGSGTVLYGYNDYEFLGAGMYGFSYNPTAATRQMTSKSVCLNGACQSWSYVRDATSATNPLVVRVTDPFGNDTLYYYHASVQDSLGKLGYCMEDGWAPEWNDGLNYRIEYYQGTGAARRLVRMETRDYDSDPGDTCAIGQHSHKNVRVTRVVTTFLDQDGRQSTTAYSEWDGLGHFKVTTELGTDVTGTRTTRTEYLGADPSRFTYREVSDGMRILARTDNTYDASGNLVLSIGRFSLPAASGTASSSSAIPGDVVTAYQYHDNRANVTVKEMGNQGATQSGGDWHTTSANYHISYSWQGGYLKTKTFYDFSSGQDFYWNAIDRVRDGNTGLVYQSFDTAGIETDYRYDDLGRVTDIVPRSPAGTVPVGYPEPEYATQIEYLGVKSTTVRQGDPNVMGSDFTCSGTTGDYIETCYDYDDLGRLAKTRKRPYNPLLGYPYQTTSYDIVGRTTFLSEWLWPTNTTCNGSPMPASCGTTYDFHDPDNPTQTDPFGRVRRVTAADGKVTRTDYFGQSSKVTVYGIQGTTGPFDAITRYLKDVWGRLVKVEMPQGGGSDAFYTYDLRDNLTQVDLANKTTGSRQSRLFQYDALNRLYSSWNPENGTTEVLGYDPMGNVTEQVDLSGNHLLFTYDGAGRLTTEQRKDDRKPTQVVMLKQNVYDEYPTGIFSTNCLWTEFGCSGGRLTTSNDYDDRGSGSSLLLTQRYVYTGLNGRLGSVTPALATTGAVGSLAYGYNGFGLQSQISYPEGQREKLALSVNSTYSNGYLTQVYDAATQSPYGSVQQYNAAGGIQAVGTPGNVNTNIVPDSRNRPAKITIGLGGYDPTTDTYPSRTDYKSGAYQYDGGGNIAAIGQSTYGYDAANRLVQATELLFGDTVSRTHAYGYDDFGNMTSDTFSDGSIRQDDTFAISTAVNNQVTQHTSKITNLSTGKILSNTTRPLSYDLRGNLWVGDSQTYDYDARNRMVALRLSSGNQEVTRYAYDAALARITKEDAARGVVTYYVRDAQGKLMSEFRRTRANVTALDWSKHYIYLGDRLVGMQENRVPCPVGGLSATTASQSVTLTWNANPAVDNVTSYKVYRQDSSGSWYLLGTTTGQCSNNLCSYSDTASLSNGSLYSYVVSAVGATEGYPSDPLPVVVNSPAGPQAPTGLAALAGDKRIDLTWNANPPADYAIGYNVYRDGSGTALNTSLITADTYFADLNLPNGTPHTYVVRAVNAWKILSPPSASTPPVTPRDYGRPGPPRDVSAGSDCNSATPQLKIQWTPPYGAADITKYLLYRSPEFPVTGCTSNCAKDVGNVTLYADPNVSVGTVYQYWVVAVDTAGNVSSRSLGVVATPRNVSASVTVPTTPLVTASDGKVTVRIIYPSPITYPIMRLYRKLNAVQDCQAYQLLATLSTGGVLCPNSLCSQDFTDGGVTNAAAYDYVVTNVTGGAQGSESGYSKPALAIPVPSPMSYIECVEDLRGSDLSSWRDGAEKISSTSNYKRLKVRVQRPGIKEYQPLISTTAAGTLGFLRGYHLYDFYTPLYWGYGDESRIKPVAVDLEKGQCTIQSANQGISCLENDTSSATCPSGMTCVTPPYPHCALQTDRRCYCQTTPCSDTTNCTSAGDYCTDTPALIGFCAGRNTMSCWTTNDVCSGTCLTYDGSNWFCSNDPTTSCGGSNFACYFGACTNVHQYDGYLNQFADGGFNTYTSVMQSYLQVGADHGCVTMKAVYNVYANGQWQRVESGYSDNFSISPGDPFMRCAHHTPALLNSDIFPGCRAPSDQPPQPLQAPTATSTSADTITVTWSPAGACRPASYQTCCPPGATCSWLPPPCPTTPQEVCVATPDYPGAALDGNAGHCVLASPAACDASHQCPSNQTCETGGVDGYYIYATEKYQSGTGTPSNPQYHFAPYRPAATVDKNTTQYTFKGIAPDYTTGSSAVPTQFSFRIATFANGGKIGEMSPASAFVTPMPSTADMPAPQSLKADAFATGWISLSWLPGATYNTTNTKLSTYQVLRSTTPGGPYALLTTTQGTGWFDSTALPNVDYYYVVKALSTKNYLSDPSPEVAARAVPSTLPADQPLRPPVAFSAQAPNPNNPNDWAYMDLSWCPNATSEGVTGYRIFRSKQPRGPYTLITPNRDASPLCLDGQHRCEITGPSDGPYSMSLPAAAPTGCTVGNYSTCRLIDKTVTKTPLDGDYPSQAANYVYYYVVTAVKRNGSGAIVSESGYSLENQGWPNYCNGTLDSCGRFDPDVIPLLPCTLPQTSSLQPDPAAAAPAEDPRQASNDPRTAPYRTIGAPPSGGGGGPSPQSPTLAALPTPAPIPRLILFHLDHLGTPRVLTDSSGVVISTHHYMPFGDERPVQPQNSTNTRQFTGHERDADSGLDYMLARYYSNSLDRFMSPDPSRLGVDRLNPQSWNRYTYALNNPINNFDLNGLYEENFHYGWTYFLAKQAGFTEEEARTIAKADNDMDHGKTSPLRIGSAGEENRRLYHGFEADRSQARNASLSANDLITLGQTLHHFQDTFSHEGFGTGTGHFWSGHGPDILSNDVSKAVDAALQTFEILSKKATERGEEGFGAPDVNLLRAMAVRDANVLNYNPATNTLTLEASKGDAQALANDLKKQGYTVAINGVIQ